MRSADEYWPKLEELGEDEVRKRIAEGRINDRNRPLAEEWLRRKQQERERHIAQQAQLVGAAQAGVTKTRTDRAFAHLRNNRAIAVIIVFVAIVVGLAAFTDSLDKIEEYARKKGLIPFSNRKTSDQKESSREVGYETKVYACDPWEATSALGVSPTWTDKRTSSPEGRRQIVEEATTLALGRLLRCAPDDLIGAIGAALVRDADPPDSMKWPVMYYDNEGAFTTDAVAKLDWQYVRLEIHVQYVQVQKAASASRMTIAGVYSEIPPQPDNLIPVQRSEQFIAKIEIFPRLFERQEYPIREEDDWARDPREAIVMLELHALAHFEAYITANSKLLAYAAVDDSERSADSFASSAVRCKGTSTDPNELPWRFRY